MWYLGVRFSRSLEFTDHVDHITTKAGKGLAVIIWRHQQTLNSRERGHVYYSLMHGQILQGHEVSARSFHCGRQNKITQETNTLTGLTHSTLNWKEQKRTDLERKIVNEPGGRFCSPKNRQGVSVHFCQFSLSGYTIEKVHDRESTQQGKYAI